MSHRRRRWQPLTEHAAELVETTSVGSRVHGLVVFEAERNGWVAYLPFAHGLYKSLPHRSERGARLLVESCSR